MKDENVYFRPRARLMLELGEQLIKNESVAMLELIKILMMHLLEMLMLDWIILMIVMLD